MSWSLLLGHQQAPRISWAGLRPRVEVRDHRGGLVVYKPKVSGHVSLGPLTAQGRLITFGRGP